MCQGFSHFSGVLLHFVLAKLASSSIRVKYKLIAEDIRPFLLMTYAWNSIVYDVFKYSQVLFSQRNLHKCSEYIPSL